VVVRFGQKVVMGILGLGLSYCASKAPKISEEKKQQLELPEGVTISSDWFKEAKPAKDLSQGADAERPGATGDAKKVAEPSVELRNQKASLGVKSGLAPKGSLPQGPAGKDGSKGERKKEALEHKKSEGGALAVLPEKNLRAFWESIFPVGEETQYEVSFMGMTAGYLLLRIMPLAQLEGRPYFHFQGRLWTTDFFSKIYSVDDHFDIWVSRDNLQPKMYRLKVNETKSVKQSLMQLDQERGVAIFWEKKWEGGEFKEKKQSWLFPPGPMQDSFSSLFYLRAWPWGPAAAWSFLVTDDEKVLKYSAQVLREEVLEVGGETRPTWVLKPKVELQGKLKTSGDFLIWIDQGVTHKILKIQAQLSFGSLKAQAVSLR